MPQLSGWPKSGRAGSDPKSRAPNCTFSPETSAEPGISTAEEGILELGGILRFCVFICLCCEPPLTWGSVAVVDDALAPGEGPSRDGEGSRGLGKGSRPGGEGVGRVGGLAGRAWGRGSGWGRALCCLWASWLRTSDGSGCVLKSLLNWEDSVVVVVCTGGLMSQAVVETAAGEAAITAGAGGGTPAGAPLPPATGG